MNSFCKHNIKKNNIYKKYIKRLLDFGFALIGTIILSPILIVIAVLVKIKLGTPIIFKQQRPGLNEKVFVMYKFRTMTDKKDKNGNLLPDSERLTPFGKKLRATSLDELPELFNILKGDLSICGPRPQLVRDMVFMTPEQRLRHSVRPGLTGLAQVNGRNSISWERKLDYDLQYIQHITFSSDIKILFQTINTAFIKKEGITGENMDTAEDLGDYLLRIEQVDREKYDRLQEEAKKILASQ